MGHDGGAVGAAAQDGGIGHHHIVEHQVGHGAALQAHGFIGRAHGQATGLGVDDESRQRLGAGRGVGAGQHHIGAGHTGVAHERLGALERPALGELGRHQGAGADARRGAVLEHREGAQYLARRQLGQAGLLLLRAAPALDGVGGQCMVDHDGGHRRAHPRQVLDHFHQADVAGLGSAVLARQEEPEEILGRQLLHHRGRVLTGAVHLQDHRLQVFLGEIPGALANQLLFFGQEDAHQLPPFWTATAGRAGASTAREITSRWIWLVPS
jgi:hypothetical protein